MFVLNIIDNNIVVEMQFFLSKSKTFYKTISFNQLNTNSP